MLCIGGRFHRDFGILFARLNRFENRNEENPPDYRVGDEENQHKQL